MKKLRNSILITLFALCALSFTTTNLNAQSFEQGDFDVQMTVGFGTAWYYSSYYKMGLPLIAVGADYALIDHWGPGVFGVGAIFGINTYKFGNYYATSNDFKETDISILPRATYHYQFVDKLDTYGGVGLGFKIRTYSADYAYFSNSTDFIFTVFVGAKYYLTDKFSVMSEIYVYDMAIFNIGVGFKF